MLEGINNIIEKVDNLDKDIDIKSNIGDIMSDLDEFYKHKKLSEKSYEFIKITLSDYVKIDG